MPVSICFPCELPTRPPPCPIPTSLKEPPRSLVSPCALFDPPRPAPISARGERPACPIPWQGEPFGTRWVPSKLSNCCFLWERWPDGYPLWGTALPQNKQLIGLVIHSSSVTTTHIRMASAGRAWQASLRPPRSTHIPAVNSLGPQPRTGKQFPVLRCSISWSLERVGSGGHWEM